MFESTYIPIVQVLDQRAMNYLNKLLYFGLAAFLSVSGALAQNNNTAVSGTAPARLRRHHFLHDRRSFDL
jgi:hypothetical protein